MFSTQTLSISKATSSETCFEVMVTETCFFTPKSNTFYFSIWRGQKCLCYSRKESSWISCCIKGQFCSSGHHPNLDKLSFLNTKIISAILFLYPSPNSQHCIEFSPWLFSFLFFCFWLLSIGGDLTYSESFKLSPSVYSSPRNSLLTCKLQPCTSNNHTKRHVKKYSLLSLPLNLLQLQNNIW